MNATREEAETYSKSLVVSDLQGGVRFMSNSSGLSLLGLPSDRCFLVPCQTRIKKLDASLHYQMESEVPLDAESMSSDVCQGQNQMVVLTDGARVLEELANSEVDTKKLLAVIPLALLALQSLVSPRIEQIFVVSLRGNIDLVSFANGQLREWQWAAAESESVTESIKSMMNDARAVEVYAIGEVNDELLGWVKSVVPDAKVGGVAEFNIRLQAAKILGGAQLPLVNLQNGPLSIVDPLGPVRKHQSAFTIAAILLLGLVATGLHLRAREYQLKAAALVTQQESVFKEVFPNQPIPIGVLSRIESEHRRLAAAKGTAGTGVPQVGNVLPIVQAFWNAAPTGIRYRIDMVDFSPKLIRKLDGNARNFEDLDVFRECLVSRGFNVPPLSASQSGKGVSLQLDQVPWESLEKGARSE